MAVSLYAVVAPGGAVINMTEWDGVTPFNVSPNTLVLATGHPNAQIGGTYIGGVFTAPAAPVAAQGIGFVISPSNGSTVSFPAPARPANRMFAYLQPAGALTSLTLNLPPSPQDNDELNIQSAFALSGVTWIGTNAGLPAALAAGAAGKIRIIYSAQAGYWFQW